MISIIICSINADFRSQVMESISKTIGVEHEILIWNNETDRKGLCQVYNELAEKARYEILAFLHEDILFQTQNWGTILLNAFREYPDAGLIGVAGSNYKSRVCSGWYTGSLQHDRYNIAHLTDGKLMKMRHPEPSFPYMHKVVCIDGVFMVCKKGVWQSIRFDDQLLRKFHFYDIDFSIRAAAVTGVYVCMNIEMTHITKGGDFGEAWVKEALLFHHERAHLLPISTEQAGQYANEDKISLQWLDWLKKYSIPFRLKIKWLQEQQLLLKPGMWYAILKFLLYSTLRLDKIHQLVKK